MTAPLAPLPPAAPLYARPLASYTRRTSTTAIVVHCSDTRPAQDIGAAEIRQWHTTAPRSWHDIGYHLIIRRDGSLELGRPLWAAGAHVAGHNSRSVGICLVGGHGGVGDYAREQWRTLRSVVAMLRALYPAAEVCGHRDFPGVAKACPSFDVRAWVAREGL